MPKTVLLYPECHADTALVRFLVKDENLLIHSAGTEVAKDMQIGIQSADIVVGIIDNDKVKPRYFDLFVKLNEQNKTCFMHKPDSAEYVIIIDKAIESFLIWNAEQINLNLALYGFPIKPKLLGEKLKTPSIQTDPNYLQLLTDLHNRQAPGFITFENILNDFLTP